MEADNSTPTIKLTPAVIAELVWFETGAETRRYIRLQIPSPDGKLLHSGWQITAHRMSNYCSRMRQNFGAEHLRPITETFWGGNITTVVITEPN